MSFAGFLSFWAVAANELIFGSARPAEAQSVEPEDALQMSEQHLDLLSFATGDGVGLGLCNRAGLVASGFVNGARDLACGRVWAALRLERAGLAVVLAREVDHRTFFVLPAILLGATLEKGSSSAQSPCPVGGAAKIHYGPSEDLEKIDVALIREASKQIDMAAYVLTDSASSRHCVTPPRTA